MPYRTKISCLDKKTDCNKINLNNSLEISATFAGLNWTDGIIELAVFYEGKNVSNQREDSINYNSFSIVSSSGIKFSVNPKKVKKNGSTSIRSSIYTVPAGGQIDTLFTFSSKTKFTKKEAMAIIKKDSFLFLHSNNSTDTLFKIFADDKKIN